MLQRCKRVWQMSEEELPCSDEPEYPDMDMNGTLPYRKTDSLRKRKKLAQMNQVCSLTPWSLCHKTFCTLFVLPHPVLPQLLGSSTCPTHAHVTENTHNWTFFAARDERWNCVNGSRSSGQGAEFPSAEASRRGRGEHASSNCRHPGGGSRSGHGSTNQQWAHSSAVKRLPKKFVSNIPIELRTVDGHTPREGLTRPK